MKFSLHKKTQFTHTSTCIQTYLPINQLPFIHIFYFDVLVLKLLCGLPLLKYT